MELLYEPRSPNCLKVLAVAAHLGLHLDRTTIDLTQNEQRSDKFLSVNPMAQVPVLIDDVGILTESEAIIQYLADISRDTQLWPGCPWDRADVARWQHWSSGSLATAVRPFQWERMFKPMMGGGQPDMSVLEAAEPVLDAALRVLDARLGTSEYIGGEAPNLADFSISATLVYAEPAQLSLQRSPSVVRWRRSMMTMPAWSTALAS